MLTLSGCRSTSYKIKNINVIYLSEKKVDIKINMLVSVSGTLTFASVHKNVVKMNASATISI